MPRRIAAGNWKMHGTGSMLGELDVISRAALALPRITAVVCLPATLIHRAAASVGDVVSIGAQDCHSESRGAHTGDISADMCADAGAHYIIVGHSERRADHAESDAIIAAKAGAVWRCGLTAIICIGETRAQYESDATAEVIERQLRGSLPPGSGAHNTIVAYEPVWAIGTGLTPTSSEIGRVHGGIRAHLESGADAEIPILYGGSVKPDNAGAIFAIENVDGALVGGASLTARSFVPIMTALADS